MQNWVCYHKGPVWDAKMLVAGLMEYQRTAQSSLAKLRILEGHLEIAEKNAEGYLQACYPLSKNALSSFIELNKNYAVLSISDDIRCQLEWYCVVEEYTQKKYGMTRTHSEVIAAVPFIKKGHVLDLGCGSGRNALYLHKLGYHVTALDKSKCSIDRLKKIAVNENLANFHANDYDINQASLSKNYDFIFSTVVMMFLDPRRIADIINNMQSATKKGGHNLIVSAMSTADYPCTVPFSFTFKEGELKDYYQDWHIERYNENVGELHRTDDAGHRIRLRFAVLLAKKVY